MQRLLIEALCFTSLALATFGIAVIARDSGEKLKAVEAERDQYVEDILMLSNKLIEAREGCLLEKGSTSLKLPEGKIDVADMIARLEEHKMTLILAPIEAKAKLRYPGYVTIDYRELK